ncbi:MAG TPA: LytTR family DNA-binding domain-containing protein [Pyrinomonadaceae bacterium]|jgi:two-component system LytT family response regulator
MERKIKCLIVDDEPLARNYIRLLLKTEDEIEIVGESGNGRDALESINQLQPDLIFLDVQMPEMDGFKVLKNLNLDSLPAIIFTTAYEEYALRAFEFHALDYLLKPFEEERFRQAVKHAVERLYLREEKLQHQTQISELLKSDEARPPVLERLLIKQNGRIVFLKTREIDWIKADDKYVHLYFGKSSYLVRQTLGAMKTQLDNQLFAQINRSAIINIERILELQTMFGADYNVVLENGVELPLSRNFRGELFDLLGKPL